MTAPIAVLGAGGVGGMLAARTGAICVATARTVGVVRERGLTLVHGEETTVSRVEATERLEAPVSLLVVAVKAFDLEAALGRIASEAVVDAVVLPLLNGLEHVDAVRRRLPGSTVAAGSIGRLEAYAVEPGFVVQRTPRASIAAASRELGPERLSAALDPLRVPGIDVVVATDERAVLWEKAARLAVLAAATAASGSTVGVLRADDEWRARLEAALAEACAVAEADGVDVDTAGQWAIIETLSADLTTSTARDLAAGRPTELDAITGSVVRAGRRLGVATPALGELLAEARRRAQQ
jgi:2-dehydropantoate 2-reductase